MVEYKTLPLKDLSMNTVRDIRPGVIDTLKERIDQSGFNPAKPLSVIKTDDGYLVADGNHRLTVLRDKGVTDVPCIVYNNDSDLYQLAIKCNQDEDTYAPMDLFDWLGVIDAQRKDGLTQQSIGDKIGWSRDRVADYTSVINHIGADNLFLAKDHQTGRATHDGANATLDFTEGWFREITKLNPDNQKKIIEMFIESKGKLKGGILKQNVSKFELYEDMVKYLDENIIDNSINKSAIIKDVYDGIYKSPVVPARV